MDQKTMEDKLATIHGVMIGTYLQNAFTQANTQYTKEATTALTNKIAQDWQQIEINGKNQTVQEKLAKLQQENNDLPESWKAAMNLIPKFIIHQ